jgi:hypothetical protein
MSQTASAWLSLALATLLLVCGAVGAAAESASPSLPTKKPPPAQPVSQGSNGDPGIGGTGQVADEGPGIGGTGNYAGGPGIGGTGIVGTITAFGSIFVNGYEIDYPDDIAIGYKGGTAAANALKVGQVVAVEANGDGEGTRLTARSIAVRYQVAGPIERIDGQSNSLVVLGQKVDIAAIDPSTDVSQLAVGDTIDVSGLRREDGVITASRIDRSPPDEPALLRGTVTAVDETGFTVNGLRIDAPADQRPSGLAPGRNVRVIGTPANGGLRARRFDLAPARPFGGRVDRLSLQGYARRARRGDYVLDGVPVARLPQGSRIEPGERVIMDGSVNRRGVFAPRRVRPSRLPLLRRNRLDNGPRRSGPEPAIRGRAPSDAPRRVWRRRPSPRAVPRPPPRPRIRRDAPRRRMRW